MATAEMQRLLVVIGLRDGLSGPLGRVNRQLGNTSRSVQTLQHNLARGLAVGAALATGAIVGSIRAAIEYEDAFAGVRKTVQATDAELEQLSDQFRELATTIPISAAEFARLGEAAGALGVPTESIKEFARVTALLGVTTNLTADEAADSLGRIGNVLHLTTAEYSQFASALVALGNAGASTESEIIQIAERAGAAGNLIGLSTEQVLAFASAVASLGVEPEAGGTALQKFFIDTTKQVAKGGAQLKLLAATAGVTGAAFTKAFEADAGSALQAFLAGLGKLRDVEQLVVLEALGFNDSRITKTLLLLANNTKLVTDQQRVASEGFRENTALADEAEKKFKTLASQLRILKNNFVELAISFGEGALPKLAELTTRLTAFLKSNRGNIEAFGAQFGKLLTDVFSEENIRNAGQFAREVLPQLAGGLQLAGSGLKFAIDAWKQLPPDLQKLLVGALVVNKISGGLVSTLISGAIQGVARGVLGITAAVVNVNGGLVNGGGIPGVGGKGGTLSRLGRAAVGVTVVGIAAEAAVLLQKPVFDLGDQIGKFLGLSTPGNAPSGAGMDTLSRLGKTGVDIGENGIRGTGFFAAMTKLATALERNTGAVEEGTLLDRLLAPVTAARRAVAAGVPAEGTNVSRVFIGNLDKMKVTDPEVAESVHAMVGHLIDVSNNQKTLAGTAREVGQLQAAAIAAGDTTLATRLGGDITALNAAIRAIPPPNVNVNVVNNITTRGVGAALEQSLIYFTSLNG